MTSVAYPERQPKDSGGRHGLRVALAILLAAVVELRPCLAQEPAPVSAPAVESTRTISMQPGENWLTLFLVPGRNALKEVLPAEGLPTGPHMFMSTRVEWYAPDRGGAATNMVWLDAGSGWRFSSGGGANDYLVPLDQGFNVVLPPGAEAVTLTVREQVPAGVAAGQGWVHTLLGSGVYNTVNYSIPTTVPLRESGLREAGFVGAPAGEKVNPNNSDELRVLQAGGDSAASPKARILMNGEGSFVYWTGGPFLQSAEDYPLSFADTLVIHTTRSASNLLWKLPLTYPGSPTAGSSSASSAEQAE